MPSHAHGTSVGNSASLGKTVLFTLSPIFNCDLFDLLDI